MCVSTMSVQGKGCVSSMPCKCRGKVCVCQHHVSAGGRCLCDSMPVLLLLSLTSSSTCPPPVVSRSHTCILSREGRVYTFGRGDHGRLGIASKANSYVPVMAHFQADSLVRVCGTHTHTHPRTHTCGYTHAGTHTTVTRSAAVLVGCARRAGSSLVCDLAHCVREAAITPSLW